MNDHHGEETNDPEHLKKKLELMKRELLRKELLLTNDPEHLKKKLELMKRELLKKQLLLKKLEKKHETKKQLKSRKVSETSKYLESDSINKFCVTPPKIPKLSSSSINSDERREFNPNLLTNINNRDISGDAISLNPEAKVVIGENPTSEPNKVTQLIQPFSVIEQQLEADCGAPKVESLCFPNHVKTSGCIFNKALYLECINNGLNLLNFEGSGNYILSPALFMYMSLKKMLAIAKENHLILRPMLVENNLQEVIISEDVCDIAKVLFANKFAVNEIGCVICFKYNGILFRITGLIRDKTKISTEVAVVDQQTKIAEKHGLQIDLQHKPEASQTPKTSRLCKSFLSMSGSSDSSLSSTSPSSSSSSYLLRRSKRKSYAEFIRNTPKDRKAKTIESVFRCLLKASIGQPVTDFDLPEAYKHLKLSDVNNDRSSSQRKRPIDVRCDQESTVIEYGKPRKQLCLENEEIISSGRTEQSQGVLKLIQCLKCSSNECVKGINFWTNRNVDPDLHYIIICLDSSLQFWTKNRRKTWVKKQSYMPGEKTIIQDITLCYHTSCIICIVRELHEDKTVMMIIIYNVLMDSLYHISLAVFDDPTSDILIADLQLSSCAISCRLDDDAWVINKYKFCENKNKTWSIETTRLGKVNEKVASLLRIDNVESGVLAYTYTHIYIWDHSSALLLKVIDISPKLGIGLWASSVSGMIVSVNVLPKTETSHSSHHLVVLNPMTGLSKVLYQLDVPSTAYLFPNACKSCSREPYIALTESNGSLSLFSPLSRKVVVNLHLKTSSFSSCSCTKNFMFCCAFSSGSVHLYEMH